MLGRLRAGQPLKATDVAREFQVGVRTAYRDLDFLRDEFRAPIEYDRARGTYLLTDTTVALPPVTLSQGEVVGLFFAEKVLAQYRGTPHEAEIASAFRKIQSLLPEEVQVLPDRILSYLSLDLGPLPQGDSLSQGRGSSLAAPPAARPVPEPQQRPHAGSSDRTLSRLQPQG